MNEEAFNVYMTVNLGEHDRFFPPAYRVAKAITALDEAIEEFQTNLVPNGDTRFYDFDEQYETMNTISGLRFAHNIMKQIEKWIN